MIRTPGEAGPSLAAVYTLDNPRDRLLSQSLDLAPPSIHSVSMIPPDANGYGGAVLWYQDIFNWFTVFLYPAGAGFRIAEMRNATPIATRYTYKFFTSTWYELRVEADAVRGTLDVYVNDRLLTTHIVETDVRVGQSGLVSGNAGGLFDDFSIRNPESPSLSCNCLSPGSFDPPMDRDVLLNARSRVLPLEFTLCDRYGLPITDLDISAPLAEVDYLGRSGDVRYEPGDFPEPYKTTIGNQFQFLEGRWKPNLWTKMFSGPGVYSISVVSGDPETYFIDPTCSVRFEIP